MILFDLAHTLPGDAMPFAFRRPAFDQARRAAHQSDDPALFAMHFVDAPDGFAVERPDPLIAKIAEPHHRAHRRGSQPAAAFSLFSRPSSLAAPFR
jgi:hypothetical protein